MTLQIFSKIRPFWRRHKRVGKAFFILLALEIIYGLANNFTVSDLMGTDIVHLAFFVVLLLLGARFARWLVGYMLWRLRHRLLVTYVFIGVVPIILILTMVILVAVTVTGQTTGYMMMSELNRQYEALRSSAYGIAWHLANHVQESNAIAASRLLTDLRTRLPNLHAIVRHGSKTFAVPSNGTYKEIPSWSQPDFAGFLTTANEHVIAAHVMAEGASGSVEVLAYRPVDAGLLKELLTGVGTVHLLGISAEDQRPSETPDLSAPPRGWWDLPLRWIVPITVHRWDSERTDTEVAVLLYRPSLVIGNLFSAVGEFPSVVFVCLMILAVLFLGVEMVSLIFGLGLTRTITRSVADLYEGTQKIKVGNFSHRIRIRSSDQLSELATSFNSMTENIQRLIAESKEKEKLESELEIAREVQTQLFPKQVPQLDTLDLAGICNPARIVGGDYYDFIALDSTLTVLAIADITGKGISAALLMASLQSALRAQLTFRNGEPIPVSTAALVTGLNKHLYENSPPEKYATLYYGIYDDQTGQLCYTNAGHLPPLLIRNGGWKRLETTGMPVGLFPEAPFEQQCLTLQSGDLVAAFTDGITESENADGEQFGEVRMTELLIRNSQKPLDELLEIVTTTVWEWTHDHENRDDMTLLLAKRL